MADEGTSFTIDIPVKGQTEIDAASKSVEALAVQLAASKDAYSAAERSANLAARAVERLSVAAEAQRGKLATAKDLGDTKGAEKAEKVLAALANRHAEASTKAEQFKTKLSAQAAEVDKVTKKFDESKKKLDELKKKHEETGKATEKFYEVSEALHRGLGKLGGPVEELAGGVLRLGVGIGKLGKAFGVLGIVAAITALIVGFTAATIEAIKKVSEFGIELANEHRSAELLAQGIARSVSGGTLLNDEVERLNKLLPLSREELLQHAQALANAGLRGDQLVKALQTVSVRAARLKFGPDFQREMLSLGQQSKVLQANIASIFGGLKIEAFLGALQKLGDLLDEDTASGRAIKTVFEAFFQPVIDGITAAEPKIEAFFLQLEIWALKALIWFKPHASIFLKIGEAFLIVSAIVIGTFATAFAIAAAVITAPVIALTYLIAQVLIFKDSFIGTWQAIKNWFAGFSLADLAKAMIDGMVKGIESGGAAILTALKGVVKGAVDGVKNFLGISSPSRLFAEIGLQTGAGMAIGVDQAAPRVANSMESMVEPPEPGARAVAPVAAPTSSHGGANFQGAQFVFNGVKDAEDAEQRFSALLTRALEGDAATLGAMAHG